MELKAQQPIDFTEVTVKVKTPINGEDAVNKDYADSLGGSGGKQQLPLFKYCNTGDTSVTLSWTNDVVNNFGVMIPGLANLVPANLLIQRVTATSPRHISIPEVYLWDTIDGENYTFEFPALTVNTYFMILVDGLLTIANEI